MDVFDLFVLIVLVISFALGRSKGFAWQVAGLASLICGDLAARRFGPLVVDKLGLSHPLSPFIGWVVIYILVAVSLYLTAWKFRKFLEKQDIDELDKHLGGVLGAVKGGLILALIVLFFATVSTWVRGKVMNTATGRAIAKAALVARNFLPPKTIEAIEPYADAPILKAPGNVPVKIPTAIQNPPVQNPPPNQPALNPPFKPQGPNLIKRLIKKVKQPTSPKTGPKNGPEKTPVNQPAPKPTPKPTNGPQPGPAQPSKTPAKRPVPSYPEDPKADHEPQLEPLPDEKKPFDPLRYEPMSPKSMPR